MRAMRIRTDQSVRSPRLSFAIILSIASAIVFISGCGNHQASAPAQNSNASGTVSANTIAADDKLKAQAIQNEPGLTPQQKQQAILELEVQTGQLPTSAMNTAQH